MLSLPSADPRWLCIPPRFDPDTGHTVAKPTQAGPGNWVGASGVTVIDDVFVLYYRVRVPLGDGGRGRQCVVAIGDGREFEPVAEGDAAVLDANSIEKGSVIRDRATGSTRVYFSYETKQGRGWRIGLVEAASPSELDFRTHRTVVAGPQFGFQHIKDPAVYWIGGIYHMFAVTAFETVTPGTTRPEGTHRTLLLTSADGYVWDDAESVFEADPSAPWGGLGARITSVIYRDGAWLAFFDAKNGPYDDYREQSGLALSHDLRHWRRVSRRGPWATGQYGPIRYVDAVRFERADYIYYEYPMEDGSHELRVSIVKD